MVKIALHLNKSVEENAAMYFEDGKKAKRKVKGVKQTLENFEKKKDEVDTTTEFKSLIKHLNTVKKHWFEKFKWFISSDGYLVIAGRDATTNEIVIKKHTDKVDLVFHTDMAGSPFVVIKSNQSDVKRILGEDYISQNKPVLDSDTDDSRNFEVDTNGIPSQTIFEAAAFTAIHSKAWKLGMGTSDVFFVKPDQVSKEANSGEFMPKGSFMIRGDTNYVEPVMDFAIGIISSVDELILLSGPLDSVKAHCSNFIELEQGNEKSSLVAKRVANFFKSVEKVNVSLDEIIKNLPSGGCQIKKDRRRKN